MTGSSGQLQAEIAALPQPLRESASLYLEPAADIDLPDQAFASTLARLAACSDFAGRSLPANLEWLIASGKDASLQRAQLSDQLATFSREAGQSEAQPEKTLRQFRNRQLLAILWREFAGETGVTETLADLSALADALISAAARRAEAEMRDKYGDVRTASGGTAKPIVLAMGKLGGRELNFSSDVDLIFLYTEDGNSDGARELSAQEYFVRFSRRVVALLDVVTEDGFVYRVDTRLRPFGDSGPPVVSFAALESYLLQHGRSWERYAYVKARVIHGDDSAARELLAELIEPFVYRRYLDYGVFESLREMKGLIETEVARRDLADNVKLGPGGIREIEFIVQSLQLVRGGSEASLRGTSLSDVLPRLAGHGGLSQHAIEELFAAYYFLRRLENSVQAIRDQQTHDLPADPTDRMRVALAMGYPAWEPLESRLKQHCDFVSGLFSNVAFRAAGDDREEESAAGNKKQMAELWVSAADATRWAAALKSIEFADTEGPAETLARFSQLPASKQVDSIARRRFSELLPRLLLLIRDCRDPEEALQRTLDVIANVLRRSAYIAMLNENPMVLERVVELCASSEYLAREISRFPLLLDEMLDPRLYSDDLARSDLQRDLAARLRHIDADDSEARINSLAQFQRATLFRIAVADFSGALTLMHVSDRLTELAEVVLNAALEIAWSDMVRRHGEPCYVLDEQRRRAGFGVVAYGKLAGMEMSYASDLDLVFLHDSRGSEQRSNGGKPLDNSMFFSRLVRRLQHFLTTQTSSGALYEVDTRLRPSGRSGLLVTSIEAFERYQEENAWTWEHQALLRSRPVAGSARIAREFERIRSDTLRNRIRRDGLATQVKKMRARMRKHLDKSDDDSFDLKQGDGGIGDIEFLVQYLVLANAADHPAVIHYPDNIRQLGTLAAADCLGEDEVETLQSIYRKYRLRLHRLALDGRSSVLEGNEFNEERAIVRGIYRRVLGE